MGGEGRGQQYPKAVGVGSGWSKDRKRSTVWGKAGRAEQEKKILTTARKALKDTRKRQLSTIKLENHPDFHIHYMPKIWKSKPCLQGAQGKGATGGRQGSSRLWLLPSVSPGFLM